MTRRSANSAGDPGPARHARTRSRLTVATHISAALALMTASLLMVSHWLGLFPDTRGARLEARQALADMIARRAADCAAGDDFAPMSGFARELLARHGDVRSIGVRLQDGALAYASESHESLWGLGVRGAPPGTLVFIPMLRDGLPFASVEVCFEELDGDGARALLRHPAAPTALFLLAAGFVGYRILMRRVLRYLDPAAVIPQRVRLVLDALAEGVVLLDNQERIVMANRAFARMAGVPADDLIGRAAGSFQWIDGTTGAAPVPAPWAETIEDGALRAGLRVELRTGEGRSFILSAACAPIVGDDGVVRGVVLTLADLTDLQSQRAELETLVRSVLESRAEIERQNRELHRLATTDPLTECLNRRALFERAEQCWEQARRHGRPLACIMIDADHFKAVNDTHGHQAGDDVLRRIGTALRASARAADTVGRFGGEEFCMLLPDTDLAGARAVAERIRATIESIPFAGFRVTASLGVADTESVRSVDALFDAADRALYAAKRGGRNRVEVADPPAPLSPAA